MASEHHKGYHLIFIVVTIISILSLIGDSYVIITHICGIFRGTQGKLIKNYVWCMAFAGVFISIKIALESIQVIMGHYWADTMPGWLCWLFGLLTQGLYAFFHLINIIIALGLLIPTMNGRPIDQLNSKTYSYILCISIFVFIQILIPIAVYGPSDAGTNEDGLGSLQCWIKSDKPGWYLTLYIPELIYVICYVFTFIWCLYKCARISCCNNGIINKNINQMLWYMLFYFIHALPSVMVRWYNIIKGKNANIVWIGIFNISISFIGIFDAIVWRCYFDNNTHAFIVNDYPNDNPNDIQFDDPNKNPNIIEFG